MLTSQHLVINTQEKIKLVLQLNRIELSFSYVNILKRKESWKREIERTRKRERKRDVVRDV